MFSVEGVKFTTARSVAEDVTDRVMAALGRAPVPCRTAEARVDEGDVLEATLEARVRRAVRDEMAVRLSDVLRRTSPGPHAGPRRLAGCRAARRRGARLDGPSGRTRRSTHVKREHEDDRLGPEPVA